MWIFTHSDTLVNSDAIRSIYTEEDCGKISIEATIPQSLGRTLGIYSCRDAADKAFLELIKALAAKASFHYMKREASEEASGNMKEDVIMCELRKRKESD